MLHAILVLQVLNVAAVATLLVVHVRGRPARRRASKLSIVDEAIALAERAGQLGGLKGRDKLAEALDWARSGCADQKIKATDAELRKLIELRLEQGQRPVRAFA